MQYALGFLRKVILKIRKCGRMAEINKSIRIYKGGLCMRIWKTVFSILTIGFGSFVLMNFMSSIE